MEQKKKIKIIIIVLAVLLGISLAALGGTLLYNRLTSRPAATVTVPDNLITPDEDTTNTESGESQAPATDNGSSATAPAQSTSTAETKKGGNNRALQ